MIPYSLNPLGVDPVNELTDLDILRQIRNLPQNIGMLDLFWADTLDPHTQWTGVYFGDTPGLLQLNGAEYLPTVLDPNKVYAIMFPFRKGWIVNADYSNLNNLILVGIDGNHGTELLNYNLATVNYLKINQNPILYLPNIISKGALLTYDLRYNYLTTSETDRLIALGFNSDYVLPQNP